MPTKSQNSSHLGNRCFGKDASNRTDLETWVAAMRPFQRSRGSQPASSPATPWLSWMSQRVAGSRWMPCTIPNATSSVLALDTADCEHPCLFRSGPVEYEQHPAACTFWILKADLRHPQPSPLPSSLPPALPTTDHKQMSLSHTHARRDAWRPATSLRAFARIRALLNFLVRH